MLWTRFENVPAYVAAQDVPFELPGIGPLQGRHRVGRQLFRHHRSARHLAAHRAGERLGAVALRHHGARADPRQRVNIQHPTAGHINNFNFVTFWHEPTIEGAFYKNVHVFSAGQLDRSPGGTGTSAMMAMFEARGQLALNQPIRSEGLLGTGTFEGCLIGEAKLNSVRAVRPTVKGKAGLLGTARWVIDRNDPVGAGFLVA